MPKDEVGMRWNYKECRSRWPGLEQKKNVERGTVRATKKNRKVEKVMCNGEKKQANLARRFSL